MPLVVLLGSCFLAACGGQQGTSIRLALDGPPLAIAATRGETPLRGLMERSCMAGAGAMRLVIPGETECAGTIDHPGNAKGRLYIRLQCGDGSSVVLAMRNLGPDQGMAVGKHDAPDARAGQRIVLFYHPSANEARHRLTAIKNDVDASAPEDAAMAGETPAR